MQIFITCTDKERFKNLGKGKFIEIEKGIIVRDDRKGGYNK